MNSLTTFIVKYWYIIIAICVLILMFIIGYYADSNGLVKPKKRKKKPQNKKEVQTQEPLKESEKDPQPEVQPVIPPIEVFEAPEEAEISIAKSTEEKEEDYAEFENYFDQVIPQKPIISDELKKYMEEFQIVPPSLQKKKEMDYKEIRLPEIKNKELDDDIIF